MDGVPLPPGREVTVGPTGVPLPGNLAVPDGAFGLVLFAHGSGSSRHSPRNRFVAEVLQRAGLATLLFDLLTEDEARDRGNVFDIPLLADRLTAAAASAADLPAVAELPVGFFGASTGAGAALWAAAEPSARVGAVVSRGGRPDLAAERLGQVTAPTLLIVGERDTAVIQMNLEAQSMMRCTADLQIVPGATHLFEEPGTLQTAATLARDWFVRYLT